MNDANRQDQQLPKALADALKRLDRAPDVITPQVDRALARQARAQFTTRRTPRWQRERAWGAAAACVLAVTLFATHHLAERGETSIYADVDGSGQIDIADVLTLARTRPGVNQADLDAFALRLVALDRDGTL